MELNPQAPSSFFRKHRSPSANKCRLTASRRKRFYLSEHTSHGNSAKRFPTLHGAEQANEPTETATQKRPFLSLSEWLHSLIMGIARYFSAKSHILMNVSQVRKTRTIFFQNPSKVVRILNPDCDNPWRTQARTNTENTAPVQPKIFACDAPKRSPAERQNCRARCYEQIDIGHDKNSRTSNLSNSVVQNKNDPISPDALDGAADESLHASRYSGWDSSDRDDNTEERRHRAKKQRGIDYAG